MMDTKQSLLWVTGPQTVSRITQGQEGLIDYLMFSIYDWLTLLGVPC